MMAITHRKDIYSVLAFSLPKIRATNSDSNTTLNFILFQSLGIIQFNTKIITKFGHKGTKSNKTEKLYKKRKAKNARQQHNVTVCLSRLLVTDSI